MNTIQNGFAKPPGFFFLEESPIGPKSPAGDAINEQKIGEVWSKHNFDTDNKKVKVENLMLLNTTWGGVSELKDKEEERERGDTSGGEDGLEAKQETKSADEEPAELGHEEVSPSHHARRPPNAFLIFCKKHRPIVRQRYPTTENRGVTKILGEWWALLNPTEKQPYNDLAKEYKDAFLSANPGFRWYKLPAPPLRTLATRPTTISKPAPSTVVASGPPAQQVYLSEFTPGKLADESQLGGLTSLMNNNYHSGHKDDDSPCCAAENNNNNNNENPHSNDCRNGVEIERAVNGIYHTPTGNTIKTGDLPPKPIKKRIYEQYEGELQCSRNIFEEKDNMTHQDLLNKVVDGIFANDDSKDLQRKSDRMCKGKRYERFMVEGKLLGNKRDAKLTQHHKASGKIEQELTMTKPSYETPPFNLETTIKRLAERTKVKIDFDEDATKVKVERARATSEPSETKQPPQISFNLDLRIDNLPSLSYDDFVKRKRENKKRKMKFKSESTPVKMAKVAENNNVVKVEAAVGSKKRKNKSSITHLNKLEEEEDRERLERADALLGLATLAMVAASTEKIDENAAGS